MLWSVKPDLSSGGGLVKLCLPRREIWAEIMSIMSRTHQVPCESWWQLWHHSWLCSKVFSSSCFSWLQTFCVICFSNTGNCCLLEALNLRAIAKHLLQNTEKDELNKINKQTKKTTPWNIGDRKLYKFTSDTELKQGGEKNNCKVIVVRKLWEFICKPLKLIDCAN